MDVLVIGGSVFLGRAMVSEALAAGHRVTVFNRGGSGAGPDGVTHIRGDRTDPEDLAQLRGLRADLVIDTCGYVPVDVAAAAAALADRCAHYCFVSTVNVFPGWPAALDYHRAGAHEGDPDAARSDVPAGLDEGQDYGWLKAGCELAVERAFGSERTTVLRAGCIVGPDDSAVGRLPWWTDRVARGGEVLVPGAPVDPVSLVDARDLARFALLRAQGVFETAGPAARDTRADLMAACREATGSDARFVYVDDGWLSEQQVRAWTEVPLWIAGADGPGVFRPDNAAAAAAGFTWRPLADTVRDTWRWQQQLPGGWQPTSRTPGLAPEKEQVLLADWRSRQVGLATSPAPTVGPAPPP